MDRPLIIPPTSGAARLSSPVVRALRFVPGRWHGLLDYGAAATLLLAPVILDLPSRAGAVSLLAGALLAAYSLCTNYALGLVRVLSLRAHLALDLAAGVALLSAPFALGLDGLGLAYLLVMGLGVFVAVAVTDTGVEQAA